MRRLLAVLMLLAASSAEAGIVGRPGRGAGASLQRSWGGSPTFEIDFSGASVAGLSSDFCLDGTCTSPTYRMKGGDADATDLDPWTYGETLTATGSGGSYNADSPLLGSIDDSYSGGGTRYYQSAGTDFGDLGTDDLIVVAVWEPGDEDFLLSTWTAGAGWGAQRNSGNSPVLFLDDTVGGICILTSSDLSTAPDEWSYYVGMIDRDVATGMRQYGNGVASGTTGNPSVNCTAAVDSAAKFTVGANTAGGLTLDGRMAHLAVYQGADLLSLGDTTDEDAWVAEQFARLTGTFAVCEGTATPSVVTRASAGTLRKAAAGVTTLFSMGHNWPRVERLDTDADGTNDVQGYFSEDDAENLLLQSEDLSTSWTALDAGDSLSLNAIDAPNGEAAADGLIGDSTVGNHGYLQAVTLTSAAYAISVYAKAGNMDWIAIRDFTVANAHAFFNLSTGALGTLGAAIGDAFIEDMGNGWFRCGFTFGGTVAAHSLEVYSASADNNFNMTGGDGSTVNSYFWGMQVELNEFRTSYVPTLTSSVSRSPDILRYVGDDGNLGGVGSNQSLSVSVDVWQPSYNNASTPVAMSINDGGSGNERIVLFDKATDVPVLYVQESGTIHTNTDMGSTDITAGTTVTLEASYELNNTRGYVNGVLEVTDTSVTIPDDLDRIQLGASTAGGDQLNGIIERFRAWSKAGEVP